MAGNGCEIIYPHFLSNTPLRAIKVRHAGCRRGFTNPAALEDKLDSIGRLMYRRVPVRRITITMRRPPKGERRFLAVATSPHHISAFGLFSPGTENGRTSRKSTTNHNIFTLNPFSINTPTFHQNPPKTPHLYKIDSPRSIT